MELKKKRGKEVDAHIGELFIEGRLKPSAHYRYINPFA